MKQNITRQQLDELTPEAMNKLFDWYDKRFNLKVITYDGTKQAEAYLDAIAGNMNIGLMIEFLDEYSSNMILKQIDTKEGGLYWEVEDFGDSWEVPTNDELSDSLWEVVKQVLSK